MDFSEFADFMDASWCKICKNYETGCKPKDAIQCARIFADVIQFAQNHDISVAEAHDYQIVKVHLEALSSLGLGPLA